MTVCVCRCFPVSLFRNAEVNVRPDRPAVVERNFPKVKREKFQVLLIE
jgi:hypothetical protein